MSTCNWLDLQTLGSQPIVPKILHDHCFVTLSAISIMNYVPFVDSDDNYGTNTNDELLQDWEEHISIVYTNARKFLGIVGQDPSDSKSNQLHVDIFWFCFNSFEVYSIDSSKMIGNSLEISNFNLLFLKLNWFI